MQYALKNMTILSGHEDMEPEAGKAVLVDGETIRDIVPDTAIPAGFDAVDLGGAYLLPGLINLHVHLPGSGIPKKGKTDYARLAKLLRLGVVRRVMGKIGESNARKALFAGTTTVRAVGGVLDLDTVLRDRINSGVVLGPRILASDCAVSVPGGHMTGSVALPVDSPEAARTMVRELAEKKPDLIKLMITGGVLDALKPGEPGPLKMPPEIIQAATEEAHKLGLRVAAHVEGTEGMLYALRYGVDTLEHGGKLTDEVLELFKSSGSALIGTLSPAVPFRLIDPALTGFKEYDLQNGEALMENMIGCIRACLDNGIPVGLGTDAGCPWVTHSDMWRELWYFCHFCGVSPAFAIHTATEVNARIAGLGGQTGTVEPGRSADLLVVAGDPLQDLRALHTPQAVMIRGKLLHPRLKRNATVEKTLDNIMAR